MPCGRGAEAGAVIQQGLSAGWRRYGPFFDAKYAAKKGSKKEFSGTEKLFKNYSKKCNVLPRHAYFIM